MSISAPLPKSLSTILQEECDIPVGFYAGKNATLEEEHKLVKACMEYSDVVCLQGMVKRAIYQTYIGSRTIYTLSLLFTAIIKYESTTFTRSNARSCILDTFRNQEKHHYNNNKNAESKKQQQRYATLIAIVNMAMIDGLIDKIDCATYFTSETLEKLNIIPCKARFDRRCQLLVTRTKTKQHGCNTIVNRIIYHYILNTMDIDNEDHKYATIPVSKADEYEKLFRSYLYGEYLVHGTVVMDIMLDLFMDEVHHNYSFWLELIKRCSDITKSPPSTCNIDSLLTSKDLLEHGDSPSCILSSLFWIKLKYFYSNLGETGMNLRALNYCLALLSKNGLVILDTLLDRCARADYKNWDHQLLMALFSLGSIDQAFGIIEDHHLDIGSDETFCDWMQGMMIEFIESWMQTKSNTPKIIRTLTTPRKIKPVGKSPLQQVVLPDGVDDHQEEVTITTATTTTTTSATVQSVDSGNSEYNDSSPSLFYHQSAFPLAQHSPIQFLKQFLVPSLLKVGGARVSATPTTMNAMLPVIERALNEDRPYVVYVCTSFVFPVLAYQPLSRLCGLLDRLTAEERLAIYLAWRTKDDDRTLRLHRKDTMEGLKALLDDSSTKTEQLKNLESTLASMALNHPTDMADVILDHVESPGNRFGKATGNFELRRILAKVLYRPEHGLALDAMAALLAYRFATFDAGNTDTASNTSSENINALRQFAKYILTNDHPACEKFYNYLDAFLRQSSTPLPSVTLLRFMCTKYLTQYESSHTSVLSSSLSPTLPPPDVSRKRKLALEILLPVNKKRRTLD